MPKGVGYPTKKLKTKGKRKAKMSFSSQMAKVSKIMSKK